MKNEKKNQNGSTDITDDCSDTNFVKILKKNHFYASKIHFSSKFSNFVQSAMMINSLSGHVTAT